MKTQGSAIEASRLTFVHVDDDRADSREFETAIRAIDPMWRVVAIHGQSHRRCFSHEAVLEALRTHRLNADDVDAIFIDLKADAMDDIGDDVWAGTRLLRELRRDPEFRPRLPIIAVTNFGFDSDAGPGSEFMRFGGTDVLEKGQIFESVSRAWVHRLMAHLDLDRERLGRPRLVAGETRRAIGPTMRRLVSRSGQMIENGANLIAIVGETGAGKGVLFDEICSQYSDHRLGGKKPRIAHIQLQTVAEPLLEAYLFGHVKGAFTDAVRDMPGALSDKDIIYFDEFQRLSLVNQGKLLRCMRERFYSRVGNANEQMKIPKDTLIVVSFDHNYRQSAGGAPLEGHMLGRLPTNPLEIPPMRERREEIAELVLCLIDRRRATTWSFPVERGVPQAIQEHPYNWPYNVGELDMFVTQLCDERNPERGITLEQTQRALHQLGQRVAAIQVWRRYLFIHELVAAAWNSRGGTPSAYVSSNSDSNTYRFRRLVVELAGEFIRRVHPEQALLSILLDSEQGEAVVRCKLVRKLVDLQQRIRTVQPSGWGKQILNLEGTLPEALRMGLLAFRDLNLPAADSD